MTELTKDEANSKLSEKAMGWKLESDGANNNNRKWWSKNGLWVADLGDFTPTTNPAHALQALEAWLDDKGIRDYESTRGDDLTCHSFSLMEERAIPNSKLKDWCYICEVEHKDLSMAICQALCSAISKEPVTIKEV